MSPAVLLGLAFSLAAPARAETVRFKTADGVQIAADFRPPAKAKPVFVLLHGLGAGRSEWNPFISSLSARGYGSLALDARGHGESGGPPYTTFRTTEAWERLELDVQAALRYLELRGYPTRRAVLAGASIGANIVLRAAAKNPRLPFAVLLSPGADYQGVAIEGALRSMDRPLLLAAAQDDPYPLRTCRFFAPAMKNKESRLLQAASGHGVRMFEGPANRDFVEALFTWIDREVRSASSSGSRASP